MSPLNKTESDLLFLVIRFLGACVAIPGGVMLLISLIAITIALVGSDKFMLSRYTATFSRTDFKNGKVPEMFVTPGMIIPIDFNVSKSIQGLWSSDDLTFTVTDPGSSRIVAQINLAKSEEWGKALKGEKLNEDVSVEFDWTVPADLPIGSTLSGRLKGAIALPDAQPGYTFSNTHTYPDMPVKVLVVAKDELVKKEREFYSYFFKVLAPGGTPVFLVGALVWYFSNRKLKLDDERDFRRMIGGK
jgi:hypothetical protein